MSWTLLIITELIRGKQSVLSKDETLKYQVNYFQATCRSVYLHYIIQKEYLLYEDKNTQLSNNQTNY